MEKLLLYCTKGKPHLMDFYGDRQCFNTKYCGEEILNGKIVAEFCCDWVEPFDTHCITTKDVIRIAGESCLYTIELDDYQNKNKGCDCLYGLHLKNVKVFDRLKDLSDYGLKKAPQNMCYVYDENGHKCILISIHPEPMCQILNGEKTIEVRRKILNKLKELIK